MMSARPALRVLAEVSLDPTARFWLVVTAGLALAAVMVTMAVRRVRAAREAEVARGRAAPRPADAQGEGSPPHEAEDGPSSTL